MFCSKAGPDPKVPGEGEPIVIYHCLPSDEDDGLRTVPTVSRGF